MRIEQDLKLDYDDVLIRPKRSTLTSRSEVILERDYTFKHSSRGYHGIPVIAANMVGVGSFATAKIFEPFGMQVCLTKKERDDNYTGNLNPGFLTTVIPTYGISTEELTQLNDNLGRWWLPTVCLDVANGYMEKFIDAVKYVRKLFPKTTIIAGNVVTGDLTEELIMAGADIVKVGIGSGAMCTTRLVAGVGYPQLSAVIECADAAHGLGAHIIADGGIVTSGDAAKAFAAGADFVMAGTMFAGHVETMIDSERVFYGNSSKSAQKDTWSGKGIAPKPYKASEGRTVKLPWRGNLENTVNELLGGLRSACTYAGAKKLKELSKRTTFIRVNKTYNNSHEGMTVGS